MKTINDYEIIDHGIEHEQYFQGCGVGHYDDCATGIGNSAHEAMEDALEGLAQMDYDVSVIENDLSKDSTELSEENYHYVSIRVK